MMPRRLLFVDDEPMVLDGLRRALCEMRFEWETKFVDSAYRANVTSLHRLGLSDRPAVYRNPHLGPTRESSKSKSRD